MYGTRPPSCRVPSRLVRRGKRSTAARRDTEDVTWSALSTATALLTSERGRSGDSQAELIGDGEPAQIIGALTIIGAVLLDAVAPDRGGDLFLELLGLAALENSTARPA